MLTLSITLPGTGTVELTATDEATGDSLAGVDVFISSCHRGVGYVSVADVDTETSLCRGQLAHVAPI